MKTRTVIQPDSEISKLENMPQILPPGVRIVREGDILYYEQDLNDVESPVIPEQKYAPKSRKVRGDKGTTASGSLVPSYKYKIEE